jgi:ribosomal 30S subunit maturation factor RimM
LNKTTEEEKGKENEFYLKVMLHCDIVETPEDIDYFSSVLE